MILVLHVLKGGKMSNLKSRKNRGKSYFFLHDLLFWQKARYDTMYNFQEYVFVTL